MEIFFTILDSICSGEKEILDLLGKEKLSKFAEQLSEFISEIRSLIIFICFLERSLNI